MERITIRHLRFACDRLNRMTGSPMVAYVKTDGRNVAQIGHYFIDQAYSGYQLARMMNDGGGQSSPLGLGFGTARETYDKIHAYIRGMDARSAAMVKTLATTINQTHATFADRDNDSDKSAACGIRIVARAIAADLQRTDSNFSAVEFLQSCAIGFRP